jgi:putative ABC transport system substrate-binding protein
MNNRRKMIIALGAGALAAPFGSIAQQQGKVWRIGFLGLASATSSASRVEAVRAGLRDLGYVENKNLIIEFRWAEGKYERLPELAADLVRLNVDVLITYGTPGPLAAQLASKTIPIVIATSGDVIGAGIVSSLARPGGNITGSTFLSSEIGAKRFELLKEVMPKIKQAGLLVQRENPVSMPLLHSMRTAAAQLKVAFEPFEVSTREDFDGAFASMAKKTY